MNRRHEIFRVRRLLGATAVALIIGVLGGCMKSADEGKVSLHVINNPSLEPRRLEIRAELAALPTDLRFKWFADVGECDPQESGSPLTMFKFADGSKVDQVAVEVWHGAKRIAHNRIEVREGPPPQQPPLPNIKLDITQLPFAEKGGPETRAEIAGKVTGEIDPDYKVLVYARDAGVWYIQPQARSVHDIRPDNTWSTWTHSGTAYAALVVRLGYIPGRTLDTLPSVGRDVLARVVLDGRKKE